MLIPLSRRTAICQSVSEVQLTGVVPLRAVSQRFNFVKFLIFLTKTLITVPPFIYTYEGGLKSVRRSL